MAHNVTGEAPAEAKGINVYIGTLIISVSSFCLIMAAAFWFWPFIEDAPTFTIALSCALYFTSHCLRAIRVSILSMDLLGVSGRTTALMHLFTAPFSLAIPFKLGELLRLHELWRLSGTAANSVITLLLDRMYDSIFLIPFLFVFLASDTLSASLASLTFIAAVVPLIVVVLGPKILTELQRYILFNHQNPHTLQALKQTDRLRFLVLHAATIALKRAPELGLISLLIWLSEVATCYVLVNAFSSETAAIADPMALLGARLSSSWWEVGDHTLLGSSLVLSFFALMALWPFVVAAYLRRRPHEPRRLSVAISRTQDS